MVKTFFPDEDKKNLKIITEGLPKLRTFVEELMETLEVLSDEELMKSIKASQKDVKEHRTISFKELVNQLRIN